MAWTTITRLAECRIINKKTGEFINDNSYNSKEEAEKALMDILEPLGIEKEHSIYAIKSIYKNHKVRAVEIKDANGNEFPVFVDKFGDVYPIRPFQIMNNAQQVKALLAQQINKIG
jgi:hypothetical protein